MKKTIREQIDDYVKEKNHIDPEILPFSRENYEIFRHKDSGKWFAVFIVKDKKDFGLDTIIKVSVHMSPAFGYDAYGRTASGL